MPRSSPAGYRPGNKEQGYVLRKLLRRLAMMGGSLDHPFFTEELVRQQRLHERYAQLKPKHPDKPAQWWFDTHGIDIADMERRDYPPFPSDAEKLGLAHPGGVLHVDIGFHGRLDEDRAGHGR